MKLGERQSLREVYVRWTVVSMVVATIFAIAMFRYHREVLPISIEALQKTSPEGTVRVLGQVVAGTLVRTESEVTFNLSGEPQATIAVRYIGKSDDNLRELKTLVMTGFFDPEKREFTAQKISPISNVGFVVAAYLLSIIPLILFLFNMERNLILTSISIKEEKSYQTTADITS